MKTGTRRTLHVAFIAAAAVLLVAAIVIVWWGLTPRGPTPSSLAVARGLPRHGCERAFVPRFALPASYSSSLYPLEGGNHAQFGDYGPQPGDTTDPT